jgi:hypothetical protein
LLAVFVTIAAANGGWRRLWQSGGSTDPSAKPLAAGQAGRATAYYFAVRLLGLGSNVFGTSSPFKSCLNRAITFATSAKYR